MKRLGIICRPFSFHGGVETSTAGLVNALVAHGGYDVDIVTTAGQFPVPGIGVRRLSVPAQPSALRQICFALAARRATRTGYDIVQSHERCLGQDVYRAGEGCHKAYLASMGRGGLQVNPQHRLLLWLEKRIFTLSAARHIVAISTRGKAEIERLYGTPADKVTVVYNGVDLARFHPDNRKRWRDETREALGISKESWLVAFVGSGFERKGLGPLIEAVAQRATRDTRLLVAGKGRTEAYRQLAARLGLDGAVTWTGPRPDIERLYAAADVVACVGRAGAHQLSHGRSRSRARWRDRSGDRLARARSHRARPARDPGYGCHESGPGGAGRGRALHICRAGREARANLPAPQALTRFPTQ